jgi:hypothetical protein
VDATQSGLKSASLNKENLLIDSNMSPEVSGTKTRSELQPESTFKNGSTRLNSKATEPTLNEAHFSFGLEDYTEAAPSRVQLPNQGMNHAHFLTYIILRCSNDDKIRIRQNCTQNCYFPKQRF